MPAPPPIPFFVPCLAFLLAGAGCAKAQFEAVDGPPATDGPLATDGPSGSPADVPPSDHAERPVCPPSPVPGCTPQSSEPCDPACQTGNCDWCSEKCSYAYGPGGAPQPTCAAAGPHVFPETCEVLHAGTERQADDCAPGSICLAPSIGDPATACFFLCRTERDCPSGVACGPRPLSALGGTVLVCDPPYQQCGPDGDCCDPVLNQGCAPNRYCLLVSPDQGTGHSRTVCDYAYGDGRDGAPCASPRDCQMRFACVNGSCMEVCGPSSPCPGEKTCSSFGAEYGYCL